MKRVMKQIKALKVHPEITLNEDNTARVHEGDWGFNITQTVGNDRPEYRAYMLAGGLYCVRERDKGHIDPYRFIGRLRQCRQLCGGLYRAAAPVGAGCECQRYGSAVQE